jgi:hypothetical protein
MNLMRFAETQGENFCVGWVDGGVSFIIREPNEFVRQVVPKFFGGATKFPSFTRKLYRWGFRQMNRGIGPDEPIIFGNDSFLKDKADLMKNMRSTTAAATRKHEQTKAPTNYFPGMKHARQEDAFGDDGANKRLMLEMLGQNAAFNAGNGTFSLTNALRPQINNLDNNNNNNSMFQLNANSQMNGMASFNPNPINYNCFDMPQDNGNNNQMNQWNFASQNANQMFQNPSSSEDIINAAISAMRYSS